MKLELRENEVPITARFGSWLSPNRSSSPNAASSAAPCTSLIWVTATCSMAGCRLSGNQSSPAKRTRSPGRGCGAVTLATNCLAGVGLTPSAAIRSATATAERSAPASLQCVSVRRKASLPSGCSVGARSNTSTPLACSTRCQSCARLANSGERSTAHNCCAAMRLLSGTSTTSKRMPRLLSCSCNAATFCARASASTAACG